MDEHVLRGNTGILKCHIPSFVSDFVYVDAWIDTSSDEEILADQDNIQGTSEYVEKLIQFSLSDLLLI